MLAVGSKTPEHRIIFIKAWNEWAEGNHLEPDLRFGKRYLEVLKEATVGRDVTPRAMAMSS
jgi:hypothetical protein